MLTNNCGETSEKSEQTGEKSGFISLTDSMSSSIKNEVADLISNIGEVGIDAALDDGLLKQMPFISTAVSIFRIGKTIRERSLLEKMCRFVKEMNAGCIDESERERRAEYFNHDKKRRSEELKNIIVILDRYVSPYRADWLARVYLSYLERRVTWDDVLVYSECIDKIILGDLYYLNFYARLRIDFPVIYDEKSLRSFIAQYSNRYYSLVSKHYYDALEIFNPSDRIKMHTNRLISVGLVELMPIPLDPKTDDVQMYQSTRLGLEFMRLLLGDDYTDNPSVFDDYYFSARYEVDVC